MQPTPNQHIANPTMKTSIYSLKWRTWRCRKAKCISLGSTEYHNVSFPRLTHWLHLPWLLLLIHPYLFSPETFPFGLPKQNSTLQQTISSKRQCLHLLISFWPAALTSHVQETIMNPPNDASYASVKVQILQQRKSSINSLTINSWVTKPHHNY